MAGIHRNSIRQENPNERGRGPVGSLGAYFRNLLHPGDKPDKQTSHLLLQESGAHPVREARSDMGQGKAKTLTSAMRHQRVRGAARMQASMSGAGQRSRQRSTAYVSPAEVGGGRQKIMMVLIPILAVTLIYLLKNPFTMSTVAQAHDTASIETVAPAVTDVKIAWEIPPVYLPAGRDPMRLPAPPVPTVEETVVAPTEPDVKLIVVGILHSEDRPAAIVDTFLVHEGEQVSGATVKKIEKDGVEFEMNGRTWKQPVEIDKKR